MARTITSANAVLLLTIADVYPVPVQLQGFSADDVFDTDAVTVTETMQGVDGHLSGGFIYNPIIMNISLMGDSASNDVFEAWYAANKTALDSKIATMIARLPSIGRSYALTRGFLTSTPPTPSARRVIQPRRHTITFEKLNPAPI